MLQTSQDVPVALDSQMPGHLAPALRALAYVLLALAAALPAAAGQGKPTGWNLLAPCEKNCAATILVGPFISNSMADILYKSPEFPFTWDYRTDDWFLGVAISRHAATLFGRIDIEPEIGIGQRLGRQDAREAWAALYARYRGFPWDHLVTTTVAVSTGINYASKVSEVENDRAGNGDGDRILHYFSPEITLALPSRPDLELVFRLHHRSGVFGIVSDARGGAQYGTVGLRIRF